MKFIKWLDERTGVCSAFTKLYNWQVPGGSFCCRWLPTSILFLFLLQALTGIFLWTFYSPSATSAWESVFYIQYVLPFGWLLRGIHHYSAQLFVAFTGLYILALILHGSYRRPREFVYWSALVILLFSLGSCLTGDLLPWSQSGYFATITRVSFLQLLPVIGVPLYQIVVGGPDPQFGTLTLTRFLFLHVCVFGGGGALLLVLWKYLDIRSRKLHDEARFNGLHKCCLACVPGKQRSLWGKEALSIGLTCAITFALVLLLVFQHSLTISQLESRAVTLPAESYLGAELTAPVDVSTSYDAARPEWSFRALYQMTKFPIFSKIGMVYAIFVLPPLIVAFFFVLPILGRNKTLHKCVLATTALFVVAFISLTYKSYWLDYSPKSDHSIEFKSGVADAKRTADRTVELAFAPAGIPKTGALSLLKDDPYLMGPILFNQHCSSCHNFTSSEALNNANPDYVEFTCQEPSAPNLYASQTADWIRGFTNIETLLDDNYFGNTAFSEKGSMIGYLKGRVMGGMYLTDNSFMLNGNGLIAKIIAPDGSPAFDVLEAVFEEFLEDEDNVVLLEQILNEDDSLDEEEVDKLKSSYAEKLQELTASKFDDEEFMAELDPQLPSVIQKTLKDVLVQMLRDDVYLELLFDEEAVELVMDEDYDTFLTDTYLARLNGNDEPIPPTEQAYVQHLRDSIFVACAEVSNILAEEAKLDELRPFVDGKYYGLSDNALTDMEFLTCTDCHAFYGTEENDHACDLRGYMSRNWIAGFISDPTKNAYYGSRNDRMPAYCPEEGEALLTKEQVILIADWLAGQWYRAPELENQNSRIGRMGVAKSASNELAQKIMAEQAEISNEQACLKSQAEAEEQERQQAKQLELEAKEKKAKENALAQEKKLQEERAQLESRVRDLEKELSSSQNSQKEIETQSKEANERASEAQALLQQECDNLRENLKTSEARSVQTSELLDKTTAEKNNALNQLSNLKEQSQNEINTLKQESRQQIETLRTEYTNLLDAQVKENSQKVSEVVGQLQAEKEARIKSDSTVQDLRKALDEAHNESKILRSRLKELQDQQVPPPADAE